MSTLKTAQVQCMQVFSVSGFKMKYSPYIPSQIQLASHYLNVTLYKLDMVRMWKMHNDRTKIFKKKSALFSR